MPSRSRPIGISFAIQWAFLAIFVCLLGLSRLSGQDVAELVGDLSGDSSAETIDLPGRWWFDPCNIGGYQNTCLRYQLGEHQFRLWALGRGSFSNDGRIIFSGQESTFFAEGQLLADAIIERSAGWAGLTTEIYLTQPFDRNLLIDDPIRESYSHNFDLDTFELSQMFLSLGNNFFSVDLGRFVSPFGRYYGPIFANSREDVPFLRGEAILFRETGVQLRLQPGIWRHSIAITNGSAGRDTNSSKALIARVGVETANWIVGASVKTQDGIGSEGQKEFKGHTGLDVAWHSGNFTIAGELIADEYGMRRPGTSLDDITWGRSLYNRQLNAGLNQPIYGAGWYVNAIWRYPRGTTVLGYGQFHPNRLGDRIHDEKNWRILAKKTWRFDSHVELFASSFFENGVDNFALGHDRVGIYLLTGIQYQF